mmetsp:Transcript_43423/g.80921  ORF Transcript_43423/g.80921 Transcript_43423/m.80921 type:complete len:262 (-) Transcript_43423:44-829(-)
MTGSVQALAAFLVASTTVPSAWANCSGTQCAAQDAQEVEGQFMLQQSSRELASRSSSLESSAASDVIKVNQSHMGSATLQAKAASEQFAATNRSQDSCSKITGHFCLTGFCGDDLSAECDKTFGSLTMGQCVCPQFTCWDGGKCAWSITQIRDATGSGIENVVKEATNVAAQVPGLADAAGAVQGVWNTVSGVFGSVFGNGGCSGYVGLCWGQCSNQAELGFTASCQYGSCQCKTGFCSQNGRCNMDVQGMLAGAMSNFQR